MTQDQILLKLCRQVRDAFATAVAALEENERAAAEAAAPDLFLEALKGEPEHVTSNVPAKQEERPREVRHRTPSDFRSRNAREGFISTTKISEQLTGKPHAANKEIIKICRDCGIELHRRSVNPDSCSHLYVSKVFIPSIVHQYQQAHA